MMIKKTLLKLIRFYRTKISKKKYLIIGSLTSGVCRYSPTCSTYSYDAINRYGIIRGSFLAIKRIFRCNPLTKGGYDPVPKL